VNQKAKVRKFVTVVSKLEELWRSQAVTYTAKDQNW